MFRRDNRIWILWTMYNTASYGLSTINVFIRNTPASDLNKRVKTFKIT